MNGGRSPAPPTCQDAPAEVDRGTALGAGTRLLTFLLLGLLVAGHGCVTTLRRLGTVLGYAMSRTVALAALVARVIIPIALVLVWVGSIVGAGTARLAARVAAAVTASANAVAATVTTLVAALRAVAAPTGAALGGMLEACRRVLRRCAFACSDRVARLSNRTARWMRTLAVRLSGHARSVGDWLAGAIAAPLRRAGARVAAAALAGARAVAALAADAGRHALRVAAPPIRALRMLIAVACEIGCRVSSRVAGGGRAFGRCVGAIERGFTACRDRLVLLLEGAMGWAGEALCHIALHLRPILRAAAEIWNRLARALAAAALRLSAPIVHLVALVASRARNSGRATAARLAIAGSVLLWQVLAPGGRCVGCAFRIAAVHVVGPFHRARHSLEVAKAKALLASGAAPPPSVVKGDSELDLRDLPTTPFELGVQQNEYLASGDVEVDAIVTVTAAGHAGGATSPELAEVLLVDCSGSMAYPARKVRAARRATRAAIDALRDGTWFALVRATETARCVYPPGGGLAQAGPATREAAKKAVRLLYPEGGTGMGEWLLTTRDLLAQRPAAIGHAVLLTDGRDESESLGALEAALEACAGRFECDCRGVGTEWDVEELRHISSTLLGTLDIVPELSALEDDFRSMIERSMAKAVGDVVLRVWTPRHARVVFLRQVSPSIEDLERRARLRDEFTSDYPTGSWGTESREYHLRVRLPARSVGEELLAARVSLVAGGHVVGQALVRAIWTDDEQLTARDDETVAHYERQAALTALVRDGLAARRRGDGAGAAAMLGRAVRLAQESGNEETLLLLDRVVEFGSAASGSPRLRADATTADEMALDTRSTRSVRDGSPRT
jgi:hypothetical protein